jgi:hypothetical protein
MMLMPYATGFPYGKGFEMHVSKVQGKIYIRKVSCEEDIEENNRCLADDKWTKRSKQGLVLQHYLMSGKKNGLIF